jgi:hypothetical protein
MKNSTNETYQVVTTSTRICIEVIQTVMSNVHENIAKLNEGAGINLWH